MLNINYNILGNNKDIPKKYSSKKKLIKVNIIGINNKRRKYFNWLKSKLDDEFLLKYEENDPDYLIYNVFYSDYLNPKYNNTIKIALYTENVMADINYADYILSHYHINYLDRCFKYSIFLLRNSSDINKKREETLRKPIRKKFCGAVITNCRPFYLFRMNFIDKLNKYKKVDMGGRCNNNINKNVTDKIEFLSDYKFSIAMENSNGDGYLSEKIIDSFRAGTIPIYYGDYFLDEFINPKTYILIKGEKDIKEKIEYIKKIDNDDNLYKSIMVEKPFIDDNFIDKIDRKEIKLFMKNIFSQDKNKAFRTDDYYCNNKC